MTTAYAVPDNPSDPEAAALELIVQIPCGFADPDDVERARRAWQDFASALDIERVFAGMTWHDAKHAATLVAFAGANRDAPDTFLRQRAEQTRSGRDGMAWDDRDAIVRALISAAGVLGIGK